MPKQNWTEVKSIAKIILGGLLILSSINSIFSLYTKVVAKLEVDSTSRVIGFAFGYGLVGVLSFIFGRMLIRSGLTNLKKQKEGQD